MPRPGTITCFLCGGTHIYPGPRYEAHLQNEHGAIFDIEFLISVSQYKQTYDALPVISSGGDAVPATPPRSVQGGDDDRPLTMEVQTQTVSTGDPAPPVSDLVCSKCDDPLDTSGETALMLLARDEIKDEPREESFHGAKAARTIKEAIKIAKNRDSVVGGEEDMKSDEEPYDDDMDDSQQELGIEMPRHFLSVSPRGGDGNSPLQPCWLCPMCPMIYKRQSYFKQHMTIAHELSQDDVAAMTSVQMTEEEFQKRQHLADKDREHGDIFSSPPPSSLKLSTNGSPCYSVDKAKRKVVGKEWAPNSFSSRFTCMFCNEQFRKDYKLKLHLMMAHKEQPKIMMDKAKEELIKAKLDGCVHMCAVCKNKYNSIANFTRHIKDVHSMSRNEYKMKFGDSEVVSRMFTCELCSKEVKHTRNIIGAHMKMVHLISWKEYQDIVLKLKSGEGNIDLPNPELFDCVICGVSVKYKREHLNKKHQLDEDVYEELIAKKARGEDISEDLPDREVFTCAICERECMDFRRHLSVCHKLTEEQYRVEFCKGENPQVKIVKQDIFNEDLNNSRENSSPHFSKAASTPNSAKKKKVKKEKVEDAEPLSTDLQCYFNCEEVFKKDYQLHLHLKLRHRNEDAGELERAYEAANEEIALTRRSASLFTCAMCPRVFNDNGAFYGHIQNKHEISYRDYKEKFGRCETESQPFECKICGKVIKYDRNTVHTHLKNVHGINWTKYLDRIRRLRRGLEPEPLPVMKMVECRVCNVSVKYLKEHLRNAHKITEKEYQELFSDDSDVTGGNHKMFSDNKVVTGMEYISPNTKKQKVAEDNLSILSFPASNHSEDYMDYLDAPKIPKIEPDLSSTAPVASLDLKLERPPKANKTCSFCEVTFDARKSFIEHCQVTHGMKFKTKSGISIPPPPSTPGPVPGEKRKLEHDSEPPLKKVRSYQTPDGYEIEIEGTPKTGKVKSEFPPSGPPSPSKLSKWNQCTYQCAVCNRNSNSRNTITTHIIDDHGISFKDYKDKYPDLEVVTNWFVCRLCNTKVKFTKESIMGHLKMGHSLDLQTYEDHYMEESDWPDSQPTEIVPIRRESVHSFDSLPGELVIAEVESGAEVVKDPWNRCQFQCKLCDAIYSDRRNIKSHVVTSHKMNYQDYVAQYGDPEIPTAKWECAVCGSETRHARNNIYIHLRDCHSMTCDQYAAQHGMPGMERGEGGNYSWPGSRSATPVAAETTQFSSKWNKCKFMCPVCNKVSNEKRHIRSHTLSAHSTSLDIIEAEYGDCETHTEYFFCAVCHAEVKHCHRNVLMHLQRSHNLTTAEYEVKYGDMDTGNGAAEDGFGQHFLITDQGGNLVTPPVTTPRIKAKCFSTPKLRDTRPLSNSGRLVRGEGNVPCENCGRMFSTLSNKERHKREHCHTMQLGKEGMGEQLVEIKKEVMEEVIGSVKEKDDLKCPIPECGEEFVRSVHLKRHLSSTHNILNPLIKLSGTDRTTAEVKDEAEEVDETSNDSVKVPPLIIKLQSPPPIPITSPTTPILDTSNYSITSTAHRKKEASQADQNVLLVEESSAEETDDEKVEIIDENTVEDIEGNSHEKVPIGVIINETSETLSENNDEIGDKVNKNDDLTIEDEIENSSLEK